MAIHQRLETKLIGLENMLKDQKTLEDIQKFIRRNIKKFDYYITDKSITDHDRLERKKALSYRLDEIEKDAWKYIQDKAEINKLIESFDFEPEPEPDDYYENLIYESQNQDYIF